MIVGSVVLGVWLVYASVNPWASSMVEIWKIERNGGQYYRTGRHSTALYNRLSRACASIRDNKLADASTEIGLGRKDDPSNPVFDYIEAFAAWKQGDRDAAVRLTVVGNAGHSAGLRLYASAEYPPDRWLWPEYNMMGYLAKNIAKQYPDDKARLMVALGLSQRLVWCEPPDPFRLLTAIEVRKGVAEKLLRIANREHDARLGVLCASLIRQGQWIMRAINKELKIGGRTRGDTHAWVMARALSNQNQRFRDAAMLLFLEKQAMWGADLRRLYLGARELGIGAPDGKRGM